MRKYIATTIILLAGLSISAFSQTCDMTVRKAQDILTEQGYNPGTIDGLWGGKTSRAVRSYQADNNLRKTGKLDRETKRSLCTLIEEKPEPEHV